MRKFFRGLAIYATFISAVLFLIGVNVYFKTPNKYNITSKSGIAIKSSLPVTTNIKFQEKSMETGSLNADKKDYDINLLLMNSIPIKKVHVQVVDETRVIPCGTPFGVKIFTQGVVVVATSEVKTDLGLVNPAKSAGIRKGDVITRISNKTINTNDEISEAIENCEGKDISVSIIRNNISFETKLRPAKSSTDNIYKVGLWVRDSSAGIGTMTFYNESTKTFAGLGHGICDSDTGDILPLLHGDIVKANINGIIRGERGAPGELKGYFMQSEPVGNLEANLNTGVYGYLNIPPSKNKALIVAMKQQVKNGPAQILTTINGQLPERYNINIESFNYDENSPCKNMIVKITDEKLLAQSGGIVQGMSGSPIIQNDMLVGAITHVFVNDPTKGYAIFAENMLVNAVSVEGSDNKKVS